MLFTPPDGRSTHISPKHIRLARRSDLDEIWAFVPRTVALMNGRGNEQWGADYPTRDIYADDIARGELWCVVHESGTIMGVGAIISRHEPQYASVPFTYPEPAVSMHRVAVDPDFEGQGVAKALFAQFESEGRRLGVTALRIDTYHCNERMQGLFAKQGFTYVGDISLRGRKLPYHCFEKLLKEDKIT